MRQSFLILLCVLMLGVFAVAENQLGISDSYQVSFSEKVRVADTLLPKGNYQIRHVMEGSDHIMVFRQLGTRKPVEVRAKCTLVPLSEKANDDQKIYMLNAANERVLHELIFKGDRAKHVF
ncbi:MAG: hypothetical protein LAO56_21695 [Acidobacteriia bacterium]|nr:hypothetical protein [Terriglobia bacterium]